MSSSAIILWKQNTWKYRSTHICDEKCSPLSPRQGRESLSITELGKFLAFTGCSLDLNWSNVCSFVNEKTELKIYWMQEIRHWRFYVKGEGSFGTVVILRFLETGLLTPTKKEKEETMPTVLIMDIWLLSVFSEKYRGGGVHPHRLPLYVTYRGRRVLVSRPDYGARMTNNLSSVPFRITPGTATRSPGHRCHTNGCRCAGPGREEPMLREALGTHHLMLSSSNRWSDESAQSIYATVPGSGDICIKTQIKMPALMEWTLESGQIQRDGQFKN